MHVPAHQVADRGVDESMPGERREAGELARDDANVEVPPLAGTGVTGVQRTIVAQFEFGGLQRKQSLAETFKAVGSQGFGPRPAGASVTGAWRCSHRACTSTNKNVSAVIPNTLKLTQVCWSRSLATARFVAPIAK